MGIELEVIAAGGPGVVAAGEKIVQLARAVIHPAGLDAVRIEVHRHQDDVVAFALGIGDELVVVGRMEL